MTIEYLTQVKENPILRGFKNEPMSLSEIAKLELKYNKGKEFPKAFREFLYLAGEFNNFAFDTIDGLEELQQYANEDLEKTKQQVGRPFFAFSVYDSQYSVIFLDETRDNPKGYIIDPYAAKDGTESLVRPNGWDFTGLVNESIRRVKNDIAF